MNIIKFEPVFEFAKDVPPLPAKKQFASWIKNLPPNFNGAQTAKKCPPMIDFMTSGYYIRSVGNYHFKRSVIDDEENIEIVGDHYMTFQESGRDVAIPTLGFHSFDQAPIVYNGIKKQIWKFYEFWTIHTPPGYSTMFIPPLSFYEQPFEMFPATVDTDDNFGVPQSFACISKHQDTGTYEWDVKKGDPIAMVIPFKRDAWDHELLDVDYANREKALDKHVLDYATDFHKKKNWS